MHMHAKPRRKAHQKVGIPVESALIRSNYEAAVPSGGVLGPEGGSLACEACTSASSACMDVVHGGGRLPWCVFWSGMSYTSWFHLEATRLKGLSPTVQIPEAGCGFNGFNAIFLGFYVESI
jgi:hypothetical protein